jgi:hypothetical protein
MGQVAFSLTFKLAMTEDKAWGLSIRFAKGNKVSSRLLCQVIFTCSTTVVSISRADSTQEDLTEKLDIEAVIIAENTSKFKQSTHAPFMQPPLSLTLGTKELAYIPLPPNLISRQLPHILTRFQLTTKNGQERIPCVIPLKLHSLPLKQAPRM